jgi:hypothetical protein
MGATPETGFLVIADLTGYTAYLAGSELEHAPLIAGDLLETIVGRLDPPFRLAKFEGDAGFLFVEDGRAPGSLLVDAIEACYLAFRRRLRSIDAATSCDCASCRLAPRLDLKVFVHHGSYVHSRIAGRDELAGSDVIIAHRLLKGTVAAEARTAGFALFTAPAVAALGLDAAALGMTAGEEAIEHLGRVSTFVWDLEARWQVDSDRRLLDASTGVVVLDVDMSVTAEASDVWAHLTSPALRSQWEGPLVIEESSVGGLRGVGTVTQCVTGRLATIEEVVDWQPYDHIGWRVTIPDVGPVEATIDLDPVESGTRVHLRWTVDGSVGADALAAVGRDKRDALGRLARQLEAASGIAPREGQG